MRKEEILLNLFKVYPKELIKLIIWYGKQEGKDIDIFMVIDWGIDYHHTEIGKLDITIIGEKWLGYMVEHFDPIVTEPFLTGCVLRGEAYAISYTNKLTHPATGQTNEVIVNYLLQKANRNCCWAIAHYNASYYREAAVTLSFAVGYIYFADYYKTKRKAIWFVRLIEEHPNSLLTKILEYSKKQKIENAENIKEFIEEIWHLLLEKQLTNSINLLY